MERKILSYSVLLILLCIITICIQRSGQSGNQTGTIKGHATEFSKIIEETLVVKKQKKETGEEIISELSGFESGRLIYAVENNDKAEVTVILKDTEYNIDETNTAGETPLLIAVHNDTVEISKMLIDAGADINKQDNISDSPYLYAGAEGRTEILSYMIEHGHPDENIYNRFGGNALIPAAEKGHLDNVNLLTKDNRSDINHQNNFGYTALIEAVALTDGSAVFQDIVGILLERGADPYLVDEYGNTALDYAYQLNYEEMQSLILEYQ